MPTPASGAVSFSAAERAPGGLHVRHKSRSPSHCATGTVTASPSAA
jgi:hypothetical protein